MKEPNRFAEDHADMSDVVAHQIIGYDSPEIPHVYTHIEKHALAEAMMKLPDMTKTSRPTRPITDALDTGTHV